MNPPNVDFELVGGGPKDGLRGYVPKKDPPDHMRFQYSAHKHRYNHIYVLNKEISSKIKVRYKYQGMTRV